MRSIPCLNSIGSGRHDRAPSSPQGNRVNQKVGTPRSPRTAKIPRSPSNTEAQPASTGSLAGPMLSDQPILATLATLATLAALAFHLCLFNRLPCSSPDPHLTWIHRSDRGNAHCDRIPVPYRHRRACPFHALPTGRARQPWHKTGHDGQGKGGSHKMQGSYGLSVGPRRDRVNPRCGVPWRCPTTIAPPLHRPVA